MSHTSISSVILLIVECQLLSLGDVPIGEEADARQVWVQAVDPHVEDCQIGVARVVDEVGDVAEVGGVDGVRVVLALVVVQVEQVGAALRI